MRVRELIRLLEQLPDQEAEVLGTTGDEHAHGIHWVDTVPMRVDGVLGVHELVLIEFNEGHAVWHSKEAKMEEKGKKKYRVVKDLRDYHTDEVVHKAGEILDGWMADWMLWLAPPSPAEDMKEAKLTFTLSSDEFEDVKEVP